MDWFICSIIGIFILNTLFIKMGVKTVPQGEEWVVERLGKFSTTLTPGLNVIFPVLDRIIRKLDVREQVMDVPPQKFTIKDNVMIRVDGILFYQILDAAKAAYQVNDLENALLNLAMTNIRTAIDSMSVDEILSQRAQINHQLLSVLDEAAKFWGIKVLRVEIKDIFTLENE